MSRQPFVCGNWKLNHNVETTQSTLRSLIGKLPTARNVEVGIAPVMTTLFAACEVTKGSRVGIAAQNVHFAEKGAFTGEVSCAHLVEAGCTYAIIGHSERRAYFGETDEGVAKKTRAALDAGLVPIMCVGEQLEDREGARTEQVVGGQVAPVLEVLSDSDIPKLVIAYEPVWAIGTGKTATTGQAQEVHAYIRKMVRARFGDAADAMRIQYGGSVKPANAKELMSEPDVDGALVGGASLDADSFAQIIAAAG